MVMSRLTRPTAIHNTKAGRDADVLATVSIQSVRWRVNKKWLGDLKNPTYEVHHQVDDQSEEEEREDYAKSFFHIRFMNLPPSVSGKNVPLLAQRKCGCLGTRRVFSRSYGSHRLRADAAASF